VDKHVSDDTGRDSGGASGDAGHEDGSARSVPLDVLPEAALLIDGGGTVVGTNELARTLFGRDPTGHAAAGLLNQPDLGEANDAPLHLRVEGRHGDRVPFIADVSVADSDVAPGHRLVLLRELDTGLLNEETGRLLHLAFESAPIGMAFFNPEGEYIRVNAALCRLLHRPPDALLGHRDQQFTHPDDRACDVDAAWRILNGEIDTWQTEKRFVCPDGSIVWAIANMTFLRDESRCPVAWLGQFQEITDRKSLEERLRQLACGRPTCSLASAATSSPCCCGRRPARRRSRSPRNWPPACATRGSGPVNRRSRWTRASAWRTSEPIRCRASRSCSRPPTRRCTPPSAAPARPPAELCRSAVSVANGRVVGSDPTGRSALVLTLSPTASEAIALLVEHSDVSDCAGLRIAAGEPTEQGTPLALSLVDEPEPDDEVVADGDATVFLEPRVVPYLDDAVLEAQVNDGEIAFALRDNEVSKRASENGTNPH
jgi:PAS domain S-box-containing protein